MSQSYVVTGGGRGIGRAIVERLPGENDAVVVIDDGPDALGWIDGHPAGGVPIDPSEGIRTIVDHDHGVVLARQPLDDRPADPAAAARHHIRLAHSLSVLPGRGAWIRMAPSQTWDPVRERSGS